MGMLGHGSHVFDYALDIHQPIRLQRMGSGLPGVTNACLAIRKQVFMELADSTRLTGRLRRYRPLPALQPDRLPYDLYAIRTLAASRGRNTWLFITSR